MYNTPKVLLNELSMRRVSNKVFETTSSTTKLAGVHIVCTAGKSVDLPNTGSPVILKRTSYENMASTTAQSSVPMQDKNFISKPTRSQ